MNLRLLIGLVAALCFGSFFTLQGIPAYNRTKQLLAEGRIVSGTVVETEQSRGSRGSTHYRLVVNYTSTEGTGRYRNRFRVSKAIYASASVGGAIPVRVSPNNPHVAMIGDDANSEATQIVLGVVILLGAPLLFVWHRRRILRA